MIEFRQNKKTGIVEVWKNGKKIGEIKTIEDEVEKHGRASQQQR